MKIVKGFFHYLGLPFVCLAFLFGLLSVKKAAKKYLRDKNSILTVDRYKKVYKLCKKYLFIKHIKVDSHGFNNIPKKPVLYICNHKSALDPVFFIKTLFEQQGLSYFCFIAKNELKNGNKFIKAAMDLIDTIYIERGNLRQEFEVFQQQLSAVQDGKSIVIFPEGTRSFVDKFNPFKAASLKVAFKSYIPIVSVSMYGSSGLSKHEDKTNKDKHKHIYLKAIEVLNPSSFITSKEEYICEQLQTKIQHQYDAIKKLVELKKQVFPKEE
ncbi:MAG: 1-acyl-sn-glycerol-3-phosphate acyltransferase [Mycoplasmataceae bacterium]|jgi:1-acyl-sn-glycerol-3-phosphate acyltransferase|nr:1-acyl-sn-glycerol-3-phosphate acyltransferase [Mycoplasmataceae bacterium]